MNEAVEQPESIGAVDDLVVGAERPRYRGAILGVEPSADRFGDVGRRAERVVLDVAVGRDSSVVTRTSAGLVSSSRSICAKRSYAGS